MELYQTDEMYLSNTFRQNSQIHKRNTNIVGKCCTWLSNHHEHKKGEPGKKKNCSAFQLSHQTLPTDTSLPVLEDISITPVFKASQFPQAIPLMWGKSL